MFTLEAGHQPGAIWLLESHTVGLRVIDTCYCDGELQQQACFQRAEKLKEERLEA